MSEANLKARITEAMKDAMRAKDKKRLGVIRLILAEVKRIEVDERIEIPDNRMLMVLDKMIKQRRDSLKQFEQAKRQDLADQESFEISVIQEYLPQSLTADEITTLIEQAIAQSGAESVKDMGKVMGVLKPQLQGKADIGAVSAQVKDRLLN